MKWVSASLSGSSAERPADGAPCSSAEQPGNDVQAAEYMTGAFLPPPGIYEGHIAPPVGYFGFYRLAFYNIGWDAKSKKPRHTMDGLATEIRDMVQDKCVDAAGISEVFNLRDDHHEYRQRIMEHLLSKLNSSAGQPATSADNSAEQPVWMGQSDGHYIFVWNSKRLILMTSEYISCGIEEHDWRMAQYLEFQPAEAQSSPPLHICHCHSPASSRGDLTDGRRKRIFKTLWAHVMRNAHDAGWGSAVQPVTVFGGDYNSTALTWGLVLKDAKDTQTSRRSVQTCTSKAIPRHNGDRAIVFNAFAVQEESGWGKSYKRAGRPEPFSDDHDVVLVAVCWRRRVSLSSSSAARPASQADVPKPINSEDPDAEKLGDTKSCAADTMLHLGNVDTTSSAAQPASPHHGSSGEDTMDHPGDPHYGKVVAAPSLIIPSQQTPLYNALLDRLATTEDERTLEDLAEFCIFDKLKFKTPYGSAAQPADKEDDPYELGLRIEHLLTVTNTQRSLHIERLASRGDYRAGSPHTLIFNSDDMMETMNTWRKQPHTWSKATEALNKLSTNQEHHLSLKSKFNTMLFEIFGNKAFVATFIKFPICSAEQPAPILRSFAQGWQSWRNSAEANRARELSQQKEPGKERLSKQIRKLKEKEYRGQWIADWIQANPGNWYKLTYADRRLWTEFTRGDISREIRELEKQQQPQFPGAAERIHALSPLPQTD